MTATAIRQGDVLLAHATDGGDVTLVGGDLQMTAGLETAVYQSLFGGDEADNGSDATARFQWWGNRTESDPDRQQRSRLQAALSDIPITSANLRLLRDAARADIEWLSARGHADTVTVSVQAVDRGRVLVVVDILVGEQTLELRIPAQWGGAQ